MSFRNEPTARTLGLTNKVSTFVGPESDPPVADGIGDVWFVEHPTLADTFIGQRRWNGTIWKPVNQSFLAGAPQGNSRVEIGQNPDDVAGTYTNQLRWYRNTETIPSGWIRPTVFGLEYHADDMHRFKDSNVAMDSLLRAQAGFSIAPEALIGLIAIVTRLDIGIDGPQNTDTNSRIQIAHSLDVTPDVVLVSNNISGTQGQVEVFSRGALTFTCVCRTSAGALTGAGVPRVTSWLAARVS